MRTFTTLLLFSVAVGARGQGRSEDTTVIHPVVGMTATIVSPVGLGRETPVDLILYALPNGNSTAETMGQRWTDSAHWRNDIQHIAAQTRELRARGGARAVVVYLEAEGKSWPLWRQRLGYDSANKVIVGLVDSIVAAVGRPTASVALTGHSGGGSFMFGYIEGRSSLPAWLDRIVFLDANYNFDKRHGPGLVDWLKANPAHRLEVVAYDDREIMLDGKKVVSDSGGTWRATQRMLDWFTANDIRLLHDSLAGFARWRNAQVEILRHPNPQNRILHTEMIGEMNAYLHALLVGRPGYDDRRSVLGPPRAYTRWVGPQQSAATMSLATGARLRVRSSALPNQLVGRLRAPIIDTVSLDIGGSVERLAIPVSSIQRLDVSRGRSHSAGGSRGAKLGAIVGGVIWGGLIIGEVATAKDDGDILFPSRNSKIAAAAIFGLVFPLMGSGGGAIVGGVVGREQWQRVIP